MTVSILLIVINVISLMYSYEEPVCLHYDYFAHFYLE